MDKTEEDFIFKCRLEATTSNELLVEKECEAGTYYIHEYSCPLHFNHVIMYAVH